MDRRGVQNAVFFIECQHPPSRSLAKFVEVFDLGCRVLSDVLSLHREIQHALQTFQFSIDRRSFHGLSESVLRWLLPAFIAVGFHMAYRDVFQLSVTEERFQIAQIRAVATDRVFGESGEMRAFKFLAQLPEPHPVTRPGNLEESQRKLAFSVLPGSFPAR
jgi:hypothetical protein